MTELHDEISALIPAYLRGETSPEDTSRIEAAAKIDSAIRADIAFQRSLGEALHTDPDNNPDNAATELAWARFSRDLDAELGGKADPAPITLPVAANDHAPRHGVWKVAALGLAAVAVIQAGVLTLTPGPNADDARYLPVTAQASAQMKVTLSGTAPIGELEALLQETGARILDGPSAIGLYTLGFDSDGQCAAALDDLRSATAIIQSATPCES